jgi:beta-galactosidase
MGNSNGSLADYWDAIASTPGAQGGFLWEWKDHALRQRLGDGTTRLAFGGQFGDVPNDGNFVADGLMSAELEPHPALREVAWVHRPVTVRRDRGDLAIQNRQSFLDLGWLRARWELLVAGEVVRAGALRVPATPAGATARVPLPCVLPEGPGEAQLTIRWTTVRDQWWAPAGHLVGWDQVTLRAGRTARQPPTPAAAPAPPHVTPRLNLWRAATDNDGFKLMPEAAKRFAFGGRALWRWLELGLDQRPGDELVEHRHTVTEDASGRVHRHHVTVPDDLVDLPRIGVLFTLPARFSHMRWFGRGPHENYPDRNRSAMLGIWDAPIDELPYLVPQEFGLRTDCRWYELIDPTSGEVVRIDAIRPRALHVSATRHLPGDLFAAATVGALVRRDEVVVCVDAAHRGLGTASCGPDVLEPYRLPAGRYDLAYRISTRRRSVAEVLSEL